MQLHSTLFFYQKNQFCNFSAITFFLNVKFFWRSFFKEISNAKLFYCSVFVEMLSPGRGENAVNISNNLMIIKKRIDRNTRVSMRRINREVVRQMAKNELGFKPYKLQKVQVLTDENKQYVQLQKCRQFQHPFHI